MLEQLVEEETGLLFQEQMIKLIRGLGLHRPDWTPCGRPVGVAEAHALLELSRGGTMSQNELAAWLHLEKSTVSRLAGLLEGRGWVERRRAPRDGRAVELRLTAAGREAAAELAAARKTKFARVLAAIPDGEQEAVLDALKVLTEAIRADQ